MTWLRGDNGSLEIFFNRDELKTRSRAEPPRELIAAGGTRFLAPIDPDAGGTWMFANAHGVVVCLLNRWHEQAPSKGKKLSRGQLVLELADAFSVGVVRKQVSEMALENYPPFTLVVMDLTSNFVLAWNGETLSEERADQPLTSSSYCFREVQAERFEKYNLLENIDSSSLAGFHADEAENTAFTVRMNRPDAQTWSRSRLEVSAGEISWQYVEEMLGLATDGHLYTCLLSLE